MKRFRVYMVPHTRKQWANQHLRQIIVKAISKEDARQFIFDNGWIAVRIELEA